MALIAYLMEHKNNYGPHLIIVPNAVMVNWKSELTQWLPSVRCVYYVGHKEERAHKFTAEVASLQFNVLVTTYEYIMRDRSRLAKACAAAPLHLNICVVLACHKGKKNLGDRVSFVLAISDTATGSKIAKQRSSW